MRCDPSDHKGSAERECQNDWGDISTGLEPSKEGIENAGSYGQSQQNGQQAVRVKQKPNDICQRNEEPYKNRQPFNAFEPYALTNRGALRAIDFVLNTI